MIILFPHLSIQLEYYHDLVSFESERTSESYRWTRHRSRTATDRSDANGSDGIGSGFLGES